HEREAPPRLRSFRKLSAASSESRSCAGSGFPELCAWDCLPSAGLALGLASGQICSGDKIRKCVAVGEPMMKDPNQIFPDNLNDINIVCRKWSNFVDCIRRYIDKCLSKLGKEQFNSAVEPPISSVHHMCSDPAYQAEYLQYAGCMKSTVIEAEHCGGQYSVLLEEVSQEPSRKPNLCCKWPLPQRLPQPPLVLPLATATQRASSYGRAISWTTPTTPATSEIPDWATNTWLTHGQVRSCPLRSIRPFTPLHCIIICVFNCSRPAQDPTTEEIYPAAGSFGGNNVDEPNQQGLSGSGQQPVSVSVSALLCSLIVCAHSTLLRSSPPPM
ncbi:hypothetical protein TSAR_010678, partial [Trichomalopsis sarcophagae]